MVVPQGFQQFKKQSSSIFDSIKNKTSVAPNTDAVPAGETGKITADVQSTKLKQMLNNLKAGG